MGEEEVLIKKRFRLSHCLTYRRQVQRCINTLYGGTKPPI